MSSALVWAAAISWAAAGASDPFAPPGALAADPPALELEGNPALRLRLLDPPGLGSGMAPLTSLASQEEAGTPAPGLDEARVARLRHWERALKWSTAISLTVTATLGTMAAVNQPTWFGDGRCFTNQGPVLGTYGCDRGLSTLHGSSGVLSAILYTADLTLARAIPGPVGNVSPGARPWYRALTYVHMGGIVIQPILGLVSAFPTVVGVRGTGPADPFPKNLRSIHVGVGIVTVVAYVATLALEGG